MAPAILITVGILVLLENYHIAGFWQGSPVILIVIGIVLFLGHTAPTEGHVQPYGIGVPSSTQPSQSDPEVKL